jgi:hypothetical protein
MEHSTVNRPIGPTTRRRQEAIVVEIESTSLAAKMVDGEWRARSRILKYLGIPNYYFKGKMSFKINAWSHYAVWLAYSSSNHSSSDTMCWGCFWWILWVWAWYPHKSGIEWPFNPLWSKLWDAVWKLTPTLNFRPPKPWNYHGRPTTKIWWFEELL